MVGPETSLHNTPPAETPEPRVGGLMKQVGQTPLTRRKFNEYLTESAAAIFLPSALNGMFEPTPQPVGTATATAKPTEEATSTPEAREVFPFTDETPIFPTVPDVLSGNTNLGIFTNNTDLVYLDTLYINDEGSPEEFKPLAHRFQTQGDEKKVVWILNDQLPHAPVKPVEYTGELMDIRLGVVSPDDPIEFELDAAQVAQIRRFVAEFDERFDTDQNFRKAILEGTIRHPADIFGVLAIHNDRLKQDVLDKKADHPAQVFLHSMLNTDSIMPADWWQGIIASHVEIGEPGERSVTISAKLENQAVQSGDDFVGLLIGSATYNPNLGAVDDNQEMNIILKEGKLYLLSRDVLKGEYKESLHQITDGVGNMLDVQLELSRDRKSVVVHFTDSKGKPAQKEISLSYPIDSSKFLQIALYGNGKAKGKLHNLEIALEANPERLKQHLYGTTEEQDRTQRLIEYRELHEGLGRYYDKIALPFLDILSREPDYRWLFPKDGRRVDLAHATRGVPFNVGEYGLSYYMSDLFVEWARKQDIAFNWQADFTSSLSNIPPNTTAEEIRRYLRVAISKMDTQAGDTLFLKGLVDNRGLLTSFLRGKFGGEKGVREFLKEELPDDAEVVLDIPEEAPRDVVTLGMRLTIEKLQQNGVNIQGVATSAANPLSVNKDTMQKFGEDNLDVHIYDVAGRSADETTSPIQAFDMLLEHGGRGQLILGPPSLEEDPDEIGLVSLEYDPTNIIRRPYLSQAYRDLLDYMRLSQSNVFKRILYRFGK